MSSLREAVQGWPKDRAAYTAFFGDNSPRGRLRTVLKNLATVEGHIAAEERNDIDGIVGTITDDCRFILVFQDRRKGPFFQIITTKEGARNHYLRARGFQEVVNSNHLTQVATDWYVFYESLATLRLVGDIAGVKGEGQPFALSSLALFPVAADGIIGEVPWSRYELRDTVRGTVPVPQAASHLPLTEARNVETHDRFLTAMQRGDIDAVLDLLPPDCVWATRNYFLPGGPVVAAKGKEEVRCYLQAMRDSVQVVGLTVLNRTVKSWYVFAEVLWRLRRIGPPSGGSPAGQELELRTAAIYPVTEDGLLLGELGYGTDWPG